MRRMGAYLKCRKEDGSSRLQDPITNEYYRYV